MPDPICNSTAKRCKSPGQYWAGGHASGTLTAKRSWQSYFYGLSQGQYDTSPHVDFRVRMGSGSCVWDMAKFINVSLNSCQRTQIWHFLDSLSSNHIQCVPIMLNSVSAALNMNHPFVKFITVTFKHIIERQQISADRRDKVYSHAYNACSSTKSSARMWPLPTFVYCAFSFSRLDCLLNRNILLVTDKIESNEWLCHSARIRT